MNAKVSAKERLSEIQAQLEKQGVKDVKFCFANTAEKPLSQVASEVSDALQARFDGKFRPVTAFDDSQNIG